ncbi:transcriptional regulator, TetR family [Sphingomonas laterariae]|uniref:Transcriptional regulator, TetR family n=1 Tax=Edaphosphingomonas laterariae TaxID=861865 RepID=A0A239FZQ4_9SPHN|nr:TetR/AcrR family transcriptional regulator [Sphingomonas laterariae]SNS62260.1 transcriptional regulator, TetR family [Sphingomonas laterariae]
MTQDEASGERRIGRPSRQQAEAIEQRILETALTVFLRHGPAVPMKAIVEASGLSSKTIYARYPNKDALFIAALRHLLRSGAPGDELNFSETGDVHATLKEFVLRSLEIAYQPDSMALQRLLTIDPDFARQLAADIFSAVDRVFMDPLAAFLTRCRDAGRIRAIDIGETARAITTLILSDPAARYGDGRDPPDAAEMAERAGFVADLLFNGMAPR